MDVLRASIFSALLIHSAALAAPAAAQAAEEAAITEAAGRARLEAAAEDVASIDAILAATYDVISGEAGEPRDWDRFRSLFINGARLMPRAGDAPGGVVVLSPEAYVERGRANFQENGFFEREIGRRVDQYGDIAQVFSAYEARPSADDAEPFIRGVNSFQLLNHGGRWWVVSIFWQAETEDNPLPEELIAE